MPERTKIEIQGKATSPPVTDAMRHGESAPTPKVNTEPYSAKLEALDSQPRRHFLFHWSALAFSVISLAFLIIAMVTLPGPATTPWVFLDIGLGIFFAVEFFTRSGFRWNPVGYALTHIFDFVAMVPALLLLGHAVPAEGLWVWLVLIARGVRAIDRVLGDGFLRHNFFALLEGFEEEITDRVLLRIITRTQADMARGNFGHSIAEALMKNKSSMLQRIQAEHPHAGLGPQLAHLVGLDTAIERAEERVYDAVVDVLNSPEVDHAIRQSIDSTFAVMRAEMGTRTWRQHLGFRHKHQQPTGEDSESAESRPSGVNPSTK